MRTGAHLWILLSFGCIDDRKEPVDMDGDGHFEEEDCDDQNNTIHIGAEEICDNVDNNCDGQIDEELIETFFLDNDGDGFGETESFIETCERPDSYVLKSGDCNDADEDINPEAIEECDEIDNNCNEEIDEELAEVWYLDADQDGFGQEQEFIEGCLRPEGYTAEIGDCDDNDPEVSPEAQEICDDRDNNCNGLVDEGLIGTIYTDTDGDGFGEEFIGDNLCAGPGTSLTPGDCDDSDPFVHPGAAELCDGIINNCDLCEQNCEPDALPSNESDDDGDGYVECEVDPDIWKGDSITGGSDCNDSNSDYALEQFWYTDNDGDGDGDPSTGTTACIPPGNEVLSGEDCDDNEPSIYGGAEELCDGIDNDCDASVPSNETDDDGDGYVECEIDSNGWDGGSITGGEDCDDTDSSVWELQTTYIDSDNDGYGDPLSSNASCSVPVGHVLNFLDCDDSLSDVNPDATEICNSIDDNCDGDIDESGAIGEQTFYRDSDNDGYGDAGITISACSAPVGYVNNSVDCDDSSATISPSGFEICDGLDNDCDGTADENLGSVYYQDSDNDGYGNAQVSITACNQPFGYTSDASDCDDSNATANPNGTEICDGVDNNCDGSVDEGVSSVFYQDLDQDGYGNSQVTTLACSPPSGYVSDSGDCHDGLPGIYPGAPEQANTIDLNCDGLELIDSSCYSSSYNGAYFLFCFGATSWYDAQARCENHGHEFASIRDSGENAHVLNNVGSGGAWIGFRDFDTSEACGQPGMNFTWTDGHGGYYRQWYWAGCSPMTPQIVGYTNFAAGQPDNSQAPKECVEIEGSGQWNDKECSTQHAYVCSRR